MFLWGGGGRWLWGQGETARPVTPRQVETGGKSTSEQRGVLGGPRDEAWGRKDRRRSQASPQAGEKDLGVWSCWERRHETKGLPSLSGPKQREGPTLRAGGAQVFVPRGSGALGGEVINATKQTPTTPGLGQAVFPAAVVRNSEVAAGKSPERG